MAILEENKLNELKTKFAELDFQDPNFPEKVEEIVNETLKANVDKIGTLAETKTIDDALEEEKEGFAELKELQEEGVLADLEDKDLEDMLNTQAQNGIEDEVAEKESLEKEGFITEAMKKSTPEDIVEEILKQLEEVIAEKKKIIDKKIEENEAMRKKVAAREKLRASRTRVNNLHKKTQNYRGTEGKKLNQNVEAAIADFDKQLEQLKIDTTRDGVEMTDAILDKENKKFEEEKKSLEDMLQGLKESYKKENGKKVKLVLIEKQLEDVASGITSKMTPEDFNEKVNALREIYNENEEEYSKEMRKLFKEKTVTIKDAYTDEDKTFRLVTIADVGLMNGAREEYMRCTSKEEQTDEDKELIEKSKKMFRNNRDVLESICGNNIEVLPLMTEEEYIEQFEEFSLDADKEGFLGKRKANKISKEMQKIYDTLKPFIASINSEGIASAYKKVVEKLKDNKTIDEDNLPPDMLPEGKEGKKENKTDFIMKVETPKPVSNTKGKFSEKVKDFAKSMFVDEVSDDDIEIIGEDEIEIVEEKEI